MEKKTNYIIREVPPEQTDFGYYFDDDGLTEKGGDYCYNLFIVAQSRNSSGFNEKEYANIVEQAEAIIDGFSDVSDKCHLLKEWAEHADTGEADDIAAFLTITTGKEWATDSAYGYCQGDYVKMVYCPEHYKSGVKHYGEIWLGAGKEFSITFLNETGEEDYTVYGYIVADCQARNDEDYKKLVCEWAGIPEDETRLEMIDGSRTYTKYNYRMA